MALTYKDVFEMNNYEFLKWLKQTFPVELPSAVITLDDMEKASRQMLKLSSEYSYISEIASYAKVYCREIKRATDKEDREMYEDMVDKKDAIENKQKAIYQAYCGISRAITVKMENNQELRMTGNRYVNIA